MTKQLATFQIGKYVCAIDVTKVQEVLNQQVMTPVPLAPSYVRGLINLRGQIVTAIDLGRAIGLRSTDESGLAMNIICEDEGQCVGFLVDSVSDVVEVDETSERTIPPSLPPPLRAVVCSVFALPSSLLLEIVPQRVLSSISTLGNSGAEA
jgi:purine-binding chemotaxis protein CheW